MKVYINIYEDGTEVIHPTREAADYAACEDRQDCIEVEIAD